MTAAATIDIGTLITRRPGVYGGRPCLAGTRFPVMQIAVMQRQGWTPEQMIERFPFLEPSWVYAGIAYYLANQVALDAEMDQNEREHEEALAAQRTAPAR